VRVTVRCLLFKPPGLAVRRWRISFATLSQRAEIVGGERVVFKLPCPRGQAPAGEGIDLHPAAGAGVLRLYRDLPFAGRREFGFQEVAGRSAQVEVFSRCVARRGTAVSRSGRRLSFRVRLLRRHYRETVPGGTSASSRRCGRGDFSVSTGFAFDQSASRLSVPARYPDGTRVARWRWANGSGRPQDAQASLICLDRQTRLRPKRH
jgi:hypothetical protein